MYRLLIRQRTCGMNAKKGITSVEGVFVESAFDKQYYIVKNTLLHTAFAGCPCLPFM